jgi:hypothetical protein
MMDIEQRIVHLKPRKFRVQVPLAQTIIALLLMISPANAGQIDYFCLFSNAAAAQADVNVGAFWNTTSLAWDTSTVFPGISVVTPAALVNGISPITGFWILVSRPIGNSGLDADTACVMKLDRDLGSVNGAFVLSASISGINRTSLTFRPVPHASAGANYPQPL